MFSLLHPVALWALAALALPLAIHLFRPPPRTVRLGSLRFLDQASRRPMRNLRWRELLLLIVRVALLALLAFLLARLAGVSSSRSWALLDPGAVLKGEAQKRWDGIGGERRWLAAGFPNVADASLPADLPLGDVWSLLREADTILPTGSTVTVFSPGRLAALHGIRPTLTHCRVQWVGTAGVAVSPARDKAAGPKAVPLNILILHDPETAQDADYLEAAAIAAGQSAGRPINVQKRPITADAENAAAADWLFWLSPRAVPASLAERSPRTVRYVAGNSVPATESIVAPDAEVDGIALWQRVDGTSSNTATAWWSTGPGEPLLSYSRNGGHEVWDVAMRFDPSWTDLPRTAALPAWVRTLFFGRATIDLAHDSRLADPSQCQPRDGDKAADAASVPVREERFRWFLTMAVAGLFLTERFLSLRAANPGPRPSPVAA